MFWLSAWVSYVQTWAQVLTHARGGCVDHRCQNKNSRLKGFPVDVNDVMHRKRARRILGTSKKSMSWDLPRRKKVDFRSLAEALWQVSHVFWGRWKSQMYLSPNVENTFYSKVIKSFVPELRSRYVFFVFRDSYVLCCLYMNIMNVLRTGMGMSISHIHVWLCYIDTVIITLLRSARILRRVMETWGDLLSLKLLWRSSANADVKNSRG